MRHARPRTGRVQLEQPSFVLAGTYDFPFVGGKQLCRSALFYSKAVPGTW